MSLLTSFVDNEDGATAIEYGLIAGLVALGAIVAVTFLGGAVQGMFEFVRDKAIGVWDNAGT